MSELDEIAVTLLPAARASGLTDWTSDKARAWVRKQLLEDESPQVVDGVLWSLKRALSA